MSGPLGLFRPSCLIAFERQSCEKGKFNSLNMVVNFALSYLSIKYKTPSSAEKKTVPWIVNTRIVIQIINIVGPFHVSV